jgi:pyruvate dehydrogenase E2 component (dihydrolipoamide acetyltransferase)
LNAWFDTTHQARRCFKELNLGLAMDTEEGLFVPVLHSVESRSDQELREMINGYKHSAHERSISAEVLKGATFTLSNFGKFAGRFASPIIVPPAVAILAVGRLYQSVASVDGVLKPHRLLPLSLSFDHRAVTGGEATRFLGAVIEALTYTKLDTSK